MVFKRNLKTLSMLLTQLPCKLTPRCQCMSCLIFRHPDLEILYAPTIWPPLHSNSTLTFLLNAISCSFSSLHIILYSMWTMLIVHGHLVDCTIFSVEAFTFLLPAAFGTSIFSLHLCTSPPLFNYFPLVPPYFPCLVAPLPLEQCGNRAWASQASRCFSLTM